MTKSPWRSRLLDLLLTVGPIAVVYGIAFLIELGYAKAFRIPVEVVQITQADLVRYGLGYLMIGLWVCSTLLATMVGWPATETLRPFLRHGVTIILLVMEIIITKRKALEKWRATLMASVIGLSGLAIAGATSSMLALMMTVSQFGETLAREKEAFLVIKDQPDRVVLRIYGDVAVTASVDLAKHELLPDRSLVLWKEGGRGLACEVKRIGPLKVL